ARGRRGDRQARGVPHAGPWRRQQRQRLASQRRVRRGVARRARGGAGGGVAAGLA
ncbi:unnamed protein product, partial [Prorocentrum cordatum]